MTPRIAIPMPHSSKAEYSERAIPQYERAVAMAGGEPVRILFDWTSAEVLRTMERCDGVLLPGSNADVDPQRFHSRPSPHTAAADLSREEMDDLLLDEAYRLRKPVLGICYGLQSLNVYRGGSLIQHIPDFLPEETRAKINHEAGKTVPVAHTVEVESECVLSRIVNAEGSGTNASSTGFTGQAAFSIPVNSSHHQSADAIGDGLRIVARCPDDGIIEALEGSSPDHFVLAVQWHPERSVDDDEPSRAIFHALVAAAEKR